MRGLGKNRRGAVTVFVTLLLIPAVLVSGTAVDLARIYAARSVVQDANQLAANAALTQYDALLQDLYGLFGVMEDDPVFAAMLDEYVNVTVFGEAGQDKSLGTFQLFYGSDASTEWTFAKDKNLSNSNVLRRQIEEYMKLRAPVIIVERLLAFLESDMTQKLKNDGEAVSDKIEIDEGLEDLYDLYKKIYENINQFAGYDADEARIFGEVNRTLGKIRDEFQGMLSARGAFAAADSAEKQTTAQTEFNARVDKIKSLTSELEKTIKDGKDTLQKWSDKLDAFTKLCEQADNQKMLLQRKVTALRAKLRSGSCSDAAKAMLPELDGYDALLSYSLIGMAQQFSGQNAPKISAGVELLNSVAYRYGTDVTQQVSPANLKSLASMGEFAIDYGTNAYAPGASDKLSACARGVAAYGERHPLTRFADIGAGHRAFYNDLEKMFNGSGTAERKRFDDANEKANKQSESKWDKFLESLEVVTRYVPSGTREQLNSRSAASETVKINSDNPRSMLDILLNLLGAAGDKILLGVYDGGMFTNFATTLGDDANDEEKSIAGIPFGTDVNFLFRAEQEYLLIGNDSAAVNLLGVAGLLFAVRYVFNYIGTFMVPSVRMELESICVAASALTPAVGILAREAARLVYAFGESVVDVIALMSGGGKAFFKTQDSEWSFSLTGLLSGLVRAATGAPAPEVGMEIYYADYLTVFMLLSDADTLTTRTKDLIEMNVTNNRDGIGGDAEKMNAAELFKLTDAKTDFRITTNVDLRMLFLSMPFAQKGVKGFVPPKTLKVSVTDYRGY